MLAAGGEAAYVSEPLNTLHRPGVLRVPTPHWYTYICEENEAAYLPALRELLAFRYHAFAEARSLRSRKDLLRMGRDWGEFLKGRWLRRRLLALRRIVLRIPPDQRTGRRQPDKNNH